MDFPDEIIFKFCEFLDLVSIYQFSRVSSRFYHLLTEKYEGNVNKTYFWKLDFGLLNGKSFNYLSTDGFIYRINDDIIFNSVYQFFILPITMQVVYENGKWRICRREMPNPRRYERSDIEFSALVKYCYRKVKIVGAKIGFDVIKCKMCSDTIWFHKRYFYERNDLEFCRRHLFR
jgi:hypothetical protein